jgi:hypothetical protein
VRLAVFCERLAVEVGTGIREVNERTEKIELARKLFETATKARGRAYEAAQKREAEEENDRNRQALRALSEQRGAH